jgi:hypothetical protein
LEEKMKISELEGRLAEARERFGDLDVYVGEVNSQLRSRIDVNVDSAVMKGEDETGDRKICIVQSYVIFAPFAPRTPV